MSRQINAYAKLKEVQYHPQTKAQLHHICLYTNRTNPSHRKLTLKIIFTSLFFCFSSISFGQTIKISVDNTNSICFDSKTYTSSKYKKNIDSAFVIMNAVFNSPEFRAFIENSNFPCDNRCCVSCRKNNKLIDSKEILDSLYKELNVTMAIDLKEKCRKKLGSTNHKEYKTIACFENIKADMPKLPLAYAIAVNLCHEYMHHIGFYHSSFDLSDIDEETPNPDGYKNDIAYRIGWDTYKLLKKWYETKVKIEGF
ncbi:MAG TPA: hypothetical protein PK431_04560 [Chitinophagales bacterium]|nr:hypothetical protein [Chitinophagales bacterium]